jgi:hypothetical protein
MRRARSSASFDCNTFDDTHGYLWEKGEKFDLNAFVPPDVSVQLADPHFINDRGEITVVGVLPDGNQHVILLVPCQGIGERGCREAGAVRQPVRRLGNAGLVAQIGTQTHLDTKASARAFALRKGIHGLRRPSQPLP